ncbi:MULTISPECIES: LytTR family DNA-binding domain-containing protein [Clostridia]|uniref:LytTR family transcriptional regulator n=1 Tax=Eisenbergiella massiliensis TaxID=1720294 RepID=A0A3E3IWC5_9FIRM|nr:LytTR family DNA-binding domain-containing protein [Eisenbergiella porci]RGE59836.1 LytTR family transcriptional regulator [Eisenbergiella massiliensis]RGE71389.1 LytTR family transcriptional regulator [Eisenbergiella massiliensis]
MVAFQGIKEFYGKIKAVLTQLPPNFLQIHQSYVINQDYVIEYTYERVKMFNGDELNISRRYRNQVRNQIIDNRRSQG